eukprot:TRINITY_DN2167_c0_g2_i1.p1 TRINITY_DN2167_c0_g2~~TRINITY_DN2167_c0_g2_i1.p1  ORF type:complete len:360 (+),score=66.25 TRINITY_DN2167_c0_g2_i1:135-1214(+)
MIRRPPRSTLSSSSAASDVYKRQYQRRVRGWRSSIMANRNQGYRCKMCPDDNPDVVEDYATGDAICRGCGLVIEGGIIDMSSEWRTFASDGNTADPSRVGAASNPLLNDSGLSTMVARDTGGGGDNPMADNLRKWNNRGAQSSQDRNLINAFREIDRISEHMALPGKIATTSKEYYAKVEKNKTLRGRSSEAIIAACVYIGCRMEAVPRTLKEIAGQTNATKKEIGTSFTYIKKLLKLNESMDTIRPENYLARFCSYLQLPEGIRAAAGFVADKSMEMRLVAGKSPISVAAAAIFFVCQLCEEKHVKDKGQISKIAGVSEVTIRNSYKDMYPARAELVQFPKDVYTIPPGRGIHNLPLV